MAGREREGRNTGPPSGPRPAVRPDPGTGSLPKPPATGGFPAVPGPPTGNIPKPPTGGFPAVPDPATGAHPAVRDPKTGFYPSEHNQPPPTGAHPAVGHRPSTQRIGPAPPSSGGAAIPPPSGVGPRPTSGRLNPPTGEFGSADPEPIQIPDPPGLGRPKPPRIGEIFDNYKIRELIGQGNMGRIYRARDRMGRNVAIKVILTEVASGEGLARFQREGQALAKIPYHKHVVGVHSNGTIRGMPYLVLDYVQGETLEDALRRGPIPVEQAALVTEKLGRALEHVHASGVLHRDLKPANILIRSEDGEPVLTDFGLADLKGADRLTQTGDMLGTPLYMAPEQVMGLHKKVDGRTDVWALGVLLYEMVSCTVPFPGTTMVEVSQKITGSDPVPLTSVCADADKSLEGIIARALTKEKELRTPSPGAMAAALRAWRRARKHGEKPPPPPPPKGRAAKLVVGGLVALALIVTGVLIATRQDPKDPNAQVSASPTPTDGGPQTSLGEKRLTQAQTALDRKDLAAAEVALIGDPIVRHELERQRETLLSRLQLLRTSALQLGRARVDAEDVGGVRSALNIAGFLSALLDKPPAQHELADAVLGLLRTLETRTQFQLGEHTIALLEALVASRLLPGHRAGLEWVEAVYFARGGAVSLDRLSDAYRRAHYKHLLASSRLGVWVQPTHLRQWVRMGRWTYDPDRKPAPEACVQHRMKVSILMVQRLHKVRDQREEAFTAFRHFLDSPKARKGLRKPERAYALLDLAHDGAGNFTTSTITEVLELDPGNPGALAERGERVLRDARKTWRSETRMERKAREALDAFELAYKAYNARYARMKTTEAVLEEIVEDMTVAAILCGRDRRVDELESELERQGVSMRVLDSLNRHRTSGKKELKRIRDGKPPRGN